MVRAAAHRFTPLLTLLGPGKQALDKFRELTSDQACPAWVFARCAVLFLEQSGVSSSESFVRDTGQAPMQALRESPNLKVKWRSGRGDVPQQRVAENA
mmetsp:Transcript_20560/g.52094  ORF Transcript_20560/g.52094 Transcript_20560/m.52094 type:complete len:98 (-) Transcript_20560:47-340(-)